MEKCTCRCRKKMQLTGGKGRLWLCLMTVMLLIPIFPLTARADIGPKPSVNLTFEGLEEEEYYVTLLSEDTERGPWRVERSYEECVGEEAVWDKFKNFSDADGFQFLGYFEKSSETDSFAWTYYPPDTFKILIYFPETDQMVVSGETYEAYAFDSYFAVDASMLEIHSVTENEPERTEQELHVVKNYDYTQELISLFCRIMATILIELGIAWLFRFRSRYQMKVIGITNVVTQTLLNVLLNLINYKAGDFAFVLGYVGLELLVFAIEGAIFAFLLNRKKTEKKSVSRAWVYALAANVASFVVGMEIAKWIPGIF